MEKKLIISQEKIFKLFNSDPLSEIMKWLIKNRVIQLTNFSTKFGGYNIPFDFRIDLACSGEKINSIGEKLADRVIEIEKILNTKFDSILCSLYSGIYSGIPTVLFLQQKYNRDFKIAVSRRSYIRKIGKEAGTEDFLSSMNNLKNKRLVGELGNNVLLHDEQTNTGNTIRDLIELCRYNKVQPKAAMIIADRILDPLPKDVHVRTLDNVPCYSLITHFEIVEWCKNNKLIWKYFYDDPNNQNIIKDNK